MRKLLIVSVGLSLISIHSGYSAEPYFPTVGKSYFLTYASKPETSDVPREVKIIKHGPGLWCLVEEIKVQPIPSEDNPDQKKTTAAQMWLNFAVLLSAKEKQ